MHIKFWIAQCAKIEPIAAYLMYWSLAFKTKLSCSMPVGCCNKFQVISKINKFVGSAVVEKAGKAGQI